MANNNVNMSKLKRAFQMLAANVPQREICEKLHMGRGVLNKYKKAAEEKGLSFAQMGRMSNEDIDSFLKGTKPTPTVSEQKSELDELLPDYVSDLAHNRYLTVKILHEKYKAEYPDGYGYTQFKKAVRDYQYSHNYSFHNTYIPGQEMQIDFAGDRLYLIDERTSTSVPVVVLVCVLPHSGYGFAKAMYNASMENFFNGISDAFSFIGGTTSVAKSDNMKQWVKKYDRYEPSFTDTALEWAAYYNTSLETCRVRTPRDKGPVEGLVRKVYNAVYATLREERFSDLNALNSRIYELMDEFNSKPSRTTGRSRLDIFNEEEKTMLGELPEIPFRFRYRKEVKLTGTYHIEVTSHKYSVPHQYVGQMISVLWDLDTVEIYAGVKRIAIHQRKLDTGYSTVEEHMPPRHVEYVRSKSHKAAYFIERSASIGPKTKASIEKLLNHYSHVEQAYRSCEGVLYLAKVYGNDRLENACDRLSAASRVTYTMISNILKKNLDMASAQKPATQIPDNEEVRGADAFTRIIEAC